MSRSGVVLLSLLAALSSPLARGHAPRQQFLRQPGKLALEDGGLGGSAGLLDIGSQTGQTPTKVEHENFLTRMKNAMVAFVLGLVLIVFSVPVLWVNESRNAKMETVVTRGQSQCRTVSGKTAEPDNRNWLVHLEGEPMRSAAKVSDPDFGVVFESNCVRLRSTVEIFQNIQHEHKEERERTGGGKDIITTYSYTTEWQSSWNDSSNYQDGGKANSKPPGVEPDVRTVDCSRVEYGGAFVLPEELVSQCCEFVSAEPRLEETLKHRGGGWGGGTTFSKRGDGYFYYPVDGDNARTDAKVGDARVRFEYVADGLASVLALQADKKGEPLESFLPFRMISRGWCGMQEEEEKLALRQAGELSKDELAQASQLGSGGGCLWMLCCACNLVSMCFSSVLTPEIFHLLHGSKSSAEMFKEVSSRMQMTKWALRLVGWLMLFAGLYMLFSPFLTFITIIPFLGPILSKLGGALIWVLCFVTTLAVASLIICTAYLVYHPLLALLYSAVAAAVVLVPLALLHVMKA
mmetsp:Transcript_90054/g.280282  ORF Transcript_90054/g.280282 Transcript_90054/m.280282 type:complete len:519 (+) Transcript_90054:80-1636(+)